MGCAALADKLRSLAIIQVIVRENKVEDAGTKCTPRSGQARDNRDVVHREKLSRDLLGEHRVVLKIKNVHDL